MLSHSLQIPQHEEWLSLQYLIFGYDMASVLGSLLSGSFTDSSVAWDFCFYANLPIDTVSVAILFNISRYPAAELQSHEGENATLMDKIMCMRSWHGYYHRSHRLSPSRTAVGMCP
jgi:hypothetical protein